jgi:GH15 family glucan-1,4-alpha-glucosidase
MRYKKISDYGIIGNLTSVALVGLDGSIDWLCFPYLDSPSVFGALLDSRKGGRFRLFPAEEWDSTAEYLPETNILSTRFRTADGVLQLIDFMPLPDRSGRYLEKERHHLIRLLEVTAGKVTVRMDFDPRFDYARAETTVELKGQAYRAAGNGERAVLRAAPGFPPSSSAGRAEWALSKGDRLCFHLQYGEETEEPLRLEDAEQALGETQRFWRSWLRESETGRSVELGPYRRQVDRSALVLKLLSFEPTGAIAAAATASLPEKIGGVRNWDYRYTWIRDTSFTLQALFNLGHLSETEAYLQWVERLLSEHGAAGMRIMYGIRGESELPEEELSHLEGYKGSRPVRIGNAAAGQRQLDIYGEIMDAALKLSDYVGKIDAELWPFLRDICDYAAVHWREKDSGIWEVRGGPRHFVYSKVMCWVALDRGLTIARRYGFPAPLAHWEGVRGQIREEVLDRGWSAEKKAFVQHYETTALDASALLIPLMGFLPPHDARVASTIDAVRRELGSGGLLHRYLSEDGLAGDEGVFLLCSFWLAQCLAARGEYEEARAVLRRLEGLANHVGLFPEEYDVNWREALGNFPQAFTHIGYINTVLALQQAVSAPERRPAAKRDSEFARGLFAGKTVLNEGRPPPEVPPRDVVPRLKAAMNVLRGAFFDTARGRVAYEKMGGSEAYRNYVQLSSGLQVIDLEEIAGRDEQLAFWINLYNVIVIHAVIELGIRDSVREVANFFGRVRYRIGGMLFSPDDIEHGILRGNRRPPGSLFRPFRESDPRLAHGIEPMDPRIHFCLVCASSSCPPIEVYTAASLEREMTIAGETFLNAGGAVVDRSGGRVFLSRIFKWYGADFGDSHQERVLFIAGYLHEREDREYLQRNAGTVRVVYQEYDWRLNRH